MLGMGALSLMAIGRGSAAVMLFVVVVVAVSLQPVAQR